MAQMVLGRELSGYTMTNSYLMMADSVILSLCRVDKNLLNKRTKEAIETVSKGLLARYVLFYEDFDEEVARALYSLSCYSTELNLINYYSFLAGMSINDERTVRAISRLGSVSIK